MIPAFLRHPFARLFWFSLITGFILSLGPATHSSQSVGAAPLTLITKDDAFAPGGDVNGNGQVDPGDILRYMVDITNPTGTDMTGVQFADTIDPNTTLVGGSIQASPIAVDDTYSAEWDTALLIGPPGVLTNDSDPDGSGGIVAVAITGGTTAQGGSFSLAAEGALIYIPPPGFVGIDTFSYTIEDGEGNNASATVTITINEVLPHATGDAYTTDAGVALSITTPDVLANDGGGGLSAAAIIGGTTTQGGTVNLAADGSFTYQPPPNFAGSDTFTYTVSNTVGSASATVTITVNPAPPIAQNDTSLTASVGISTNFSIGTLFNDNGSGADYRGAPAATVVSFGGGTITGSTLVTHFAAGATTSAGTFAGGTLTVNMDGSFSVNNPTVSGSFTFMYRIQNTVGFSDAAVTITIQEAPLAQPDVYSFLYTIDQVTPNSLLLANGGAADTLGNPAAVVTTFGGGVLLPYAAGTPVALAGGTLTVNASGTWSLTGQPFTPGAYTFSYEIANSAGSSAAAVTLNIQSPVTAAADALYTVVSGSTLLVTAADPNDLLDNDIVGFPVGSIISFGAGSLGGAITDNGSGASVTPIPGYTDGSLTVNTDGSFSFTPPTLATPFCGDFTFAYRLDNGISSSDADVTVTVQCAPLAQDDNFPSGFTTGPGGLTLTGNLFADNGNGADFFGIPPGALTSFGGGSFLGGSVTGNAAGATVTFLDGSLTVNADGTFTLADVTTPGTYTFQYRLSNAIPAFDDATVTIEVDGAPEVTSTTPTDGAINVPSHSTITINFDENVDMSFVGLTVECPVGTPIPYLPTTAVNTNSITVSPTISLPGDKICTVTVVAANVTDTDTADPPNLLDGNGDGITGDDYVFTFRVAPEAMDDAYTVNPHLTYTSPTSVIANDIPQGSAVTGFGESLETANATVPNGTNTITAGGAGGTVRMNADGTFDYFPPPGVRNNEATFFYTIIGGDTARVRLIIPLDARIWFVDATYAGANGVSDGTQRRPFTLLAGAPGSFDAAASDRMGDFIFIADGSYTCGLTLLDYQHLIGDGSSSNLTSITGLTPVAGSSLPAFSGTDPVLSNSAGDCLTLGRDNTLRGVTMSNNGKYALTGDAIGTATLTESSITGSGGLFDLTVGGTFNATFDTLTSTGHTSAIINMNAVGGTISNTDGSITHAANANTISITAGNPTFTYTGDVTKTATGLLVSLTNLTSSTVAFAAGSSISATNGDGFLFDNVDSPVSFNGTTTLNGGAARVRIQNGSSGTFDFASGTITNPTGFSAFTINASAALGTFTGNINDNSEFVLDVNDLQTGGAYTFNGGTLTSTGGTGARVIDSEGNITVNNLLLGSSGASLGADALTLTTNTGTYTFTTLNSFTSGATARAIFANNGGTINIPAGTVNAAGSAAVDITGAALNVTLTSVSANGGTNGIVLNTTTGSFTVVGNGAAGSGGTIQNTTGSGMELTNVQDLEFSYLNISNTGSHGVNGTQVNGFAFLNSMMQNGGNADGESGLNFSRAVTFDENNLSGTVLIENSTISGTSEHLINIENFAGNLNMTIRGSTLSDNLSAYGENGLLLRSDGSATATVTIENSTFSGIDGNGIQLVAEGPSGVVNTSITGTLVQNSGAMGIVLFSGDSSGNVSRLNFNIFNNLQANGDGVIGTHSTAISIQPNGSSIMNGIVTSTSVSGSSIGRGIEVLTDDSADATIAIAGNSVSSTEFNGIFVSNQNTAQMDLSIRNNNIFAPLDLTNSGLAVHGVEVNVRGTSVNCLDIANNSSAGATENGGAAYRTRQRDTSTFQLERFTGDGTNLTDVRNFLVAQNTEGNASSTVAVTYTGVADGFCSDPVVFSPLEADTIIAQADDTKSDETVFKPSAAPAMSGETVNVTIGTLPASDTVTLTFDVTLDSPLLAGVTQVCNQGTVSGSLGGTAFSEVTDDPETAAADDRTCTPVSAASVMSASKTAADVDGGNTVPGDVVEFTITIANTGNQGAGGTTLTDPIPANTSYVAGSTTLNGSAVADVGGTMPYAGGGLVNNPAALAGVVEAGQTAVVVFRVTVNDPFLVGVNSISNQGTVSGVGFSTILTDDPGAGGGSDPTTITVLAGLTFTKAFLTDPIQIGDTTTLQFIIANPAGNPALTNLSFTDDLPAGLVYVAPVTSPQCGGTVALVDADTLAFNGGSLDAGGCTIDVTVQSDGANTGLLTNTTSSLTAASGISTAAAVDTIFVGTPPTAIPTGGTPEPVSTFPAPPPTLLCVDHNFDPNSVVRANLPDEYRSAVFCRLVVQNGDYIWWNGYYITNAGMIGHQGVLDLGVEQAVDVFSPTGPEDYEDGAVICLRGSGGTTLFLDSKESPRNAHIMTTFTADDFPGHTCVTLYGPGTLVLVRTVLDQTGLEDDGSIPLNNCSVTTQYMSLFRATPSLDGEILGRVPYQARLEATGYLPGWYRVIMGDTQGWVSASLVTTAGDCGV